eukprot:SAG31_NODE_1482_length_8175_cov_4.484398_9_plen_55_part_00
MRPDAVTDAWPHTVASSATSKMNKKASAPVVWTVNAPESTCEPATQLDCLIYML